MNVKETSLSDHHGAILTVLLAAPGMGPMPLHSYTPPTHTTQGLPSLKELSCCNN